MGAARWRRHYDLTPGAAELGMVCGGDIDVEVRGAQMKEITLFLLNNCPHCKLALRLQEELLEEHPAWRDIPLRMVDEAAGARLCRYL